MFMIRVIIIVFLDSKTFFKLEQAVKGKNCKNHKDLVHLDQYIHTLHISILQNYLIFPGVFGVTMSLFIVWFVLNFSSWYPNP